MTNIPIRAIVNGIGIFVSLFVVLGLPSVYYLVRHNDHISMLDFKAKLNASRIEKYIYVRGDLWEFQSARLIGLIELPDRQHEGIQQVVENAAGEVILKTGKKLLPPLHSRKTQLTVHGEVVGNLSVSASHRPLLISTGQLSLLSLLIGLATFYGLRTLPLRVLDKTIRDLEQQSERAKQADKAKSEFLANMSHEIRTPMNGVMGMAELLSKSDLNEKQTMFTDVIIRSGGALVTIINDILDFSKIDAGRLAIDPQPFKLADAVEDVAALVSAGAEQKQLELAVRVQPDLPEYYVGDSGRIRQVITNLLGNAVKFTNAGHVLIDISGTIKTDKNETEDNTIAELLIKVEDTGIGIPPDKVDHIFRKFAQVDGSSTRTHDGTGLGLAIARKLAEIMGGELGVNSEVGKGSTFWFTLPLPVHNTQSQRKRVPVDVSGARILVIDDNEVNRSILLEQLSAWKFKATAVASGPDGLAALGHARQAGQPINLVILDYHMPDMDGADVADQIRADAVIKDTPVVMLTSVDDDRNSQRLRDLVIQGHLVKPARASQLLDTIISVLQDAHEVNTDAKLTEKKDVEISTRGAGRAPKIILGAPARRVENETIVKQERRKKDVIILVAEDNEVNQIVVEQILVDAGHSYAIVENGKLALERFKAQRPDLVLMDVSMPEMSGLEATKAIREVEKNAADGRHTPIIGITAHALKGDRETCMNAGMDDYLPKPISLNALQSKIDEWLEKSEPDSKVDRLAAG